MAQLYDRTLLRRGCSVGAIATNEYGVTVGRYAFIGAGPVVSKDVPDNSGAMSRVTRQTNEEVRVHTLQH